MGRFTAGDVIASKYHVEHLLGAGGMGYVVAARHLHLGHIVALKFVRAGILDSDEARRRFLREAKAAASMRSDHIARVLDVALLEDGTPYMVMEYLEGQDLASVAKERGRLSVEEACDYALQTCEGLAEAHAAGIVHRDIKPANLFLTKGPGGIPLVKILDFGISKADPIGEGTSVTGTKAMLGSPRFMSPEQIRDARLVDPRSDIWSVGVVLYRLLTGGWPFEADNLGALIAKITSEAPVEPLPKDLPRGLSDVILRCLEKSRDKRFGNVGELGSALAAFTASPTMAGLHVDRIYDLLSTSASEPQFNSLSEETTGWGGTRGVTPKRANYTFLAAGLALAALGTMGLYLHAQKPKVEWTTDAARTPAYDEVLATDVNRPSSADVTRSNNQSAGQPPQQPYVDPTGQQPAGQQQPGSGGLAAQMPMVPAGYAAPLGQGAQTMQVAPQNAYVPQPQNMMPAVQPNGFPPNVGNVAGPNGGAAVAPNVAPGVRKRSPNPTVRPTTRDTSKPRTSEDGDGIPNSRF